MINRIDEKFQELKKGGRKALIFYLTVGYPDMVTFMKLVTALENFGADLIELGVPFSDPVADGLTIQRTSEVALKQKINLKKSFLLAKELSKKSNIPLIFMSYYNPIYHYGLQKFAHDCKKTGISGVIIPDLPPEEATPLKNILKQDNVNLIFLIAPTSPQERMRMISKESQGFIYYVSLTGVTGARRNCPERLNLPCIKFTGSLKNQSVSVLASPSHLKRGRLESIAMGLSLAVPF